MAFPQGINFREFLAFVTDGADEDFADTDAFNPTYPQTTTQGNTVGWEDVLDGGFRDRNSGIDRRLAGMNFAGNAPRFRFDLPASGNYNVRLAAGDHDNACDTGVELFDTTSSLGTLSTGSTSTSAAFKDATNTEYSTANWPGSNTAASKTFATTICRFQLASGGSQRIAHLHVAAASGGGAITGDIPLTLTPVGTLTGTGALAGSVALTITPQGALTGSGALAGSATLSLDVSGTLEDSEAGAVTGSVSLTITPAGTLTGAGALVGAIPLSLTPQGALTGSGALAGSVPLSISVDGALDGELAGAMTGSAGLALDVSGTLTGAGALAGSVDLGITVSGRFPQPESEFSGGFYFAFEREMERRRRERRKREEDEEEARQLQDEIDREIAVLLHQKEAKDAQGRELDRLKVMVAQFADKAAEEAMTERVRNALIRANVQQNISAYLALERELTRALEEEEFIVLMALIS